MVPHRQKTITTRTMQVSAALLAGVLLGGCGQQSDNATTDPALAAGQEPVKPASTSTAPPDTNPATTQASPASPAARSTTSSSAKQAAPVDRTRQRTRQQSPVPEESEGAGSTTVERCHTSMLDGSLRQGHPGAGQRYAELILRNDSGQTCTVYGYAGLQLVGADGQPLPTETVRTATPGPRVVRLAPTESTTATLHWGVVPTGDEPATGPCQPDPARLRVIPPDETDALTIDWPFGRVCGGGNINITAFH